ncbi:hypothetical protein DVH24_025340 [Malus domestica]|uniref:Desiccation-related protein PCC13-62 n=1 Tax=Malus domestica TaxID=3750 RepID=A0A498HLN8_MALDO|nr:hypothetical protein DVH24_025340 [Malus domestica]
MPLQPPPLLPSSSSSHCLTHPNRFWTTTTTTPPPLSRNHLLEFPLNLEYLEAEFFLYGAFGHGLDTVDPSLTLGGPTPVGPKRAHLDHFARDVITQFGWQEVGHSRAIKKTVKGFPRPLLNLSAESFSHVFDSAFGSPLNPPFDPYANSINYLLASYLIPYVGLTGYVGASPMLQGATSKRLVAGLLGVESGQDAVIRALLYEHVNLIVKPYGITVAEFTNRISSLRNKLGRTGLKDEGLVVHEYRGAQGKISGNILAGDKYSVVYGSGDERVTGGIYPKGADGRIAKSYLKKE